MPQIDLHLLKDIVPKFQQYLATEGKQWLDERQEKDRFFQRHFSAQALDNLDEGVVRELIYILWAFNGWTNKDYIVEEMLQSGLATIRDAFRQLLFGNDPVVKRFNEVKKNVRMMGAASISEILAHHDHETYPIWTSRSRQGLIGLGVSDDLLPRSVQISGSQYESFCKLVKNVRAEISTVYPEYSDLFKLDLLLYFISLEQLTPDRPSLSDTKEEANGDFDHDAAIQQVLELGDGLGFEVQKEFSIMKGCRIDALWRSRVANLGTIAYAFEVHRKGSRDSAILNLQRVRRDPSIQKVIIVSSRTEIEEFKSEIQTLDEGFRNSIGYFEIHDLQRALDHLQALKNIMKSLGLLNVEAFFE